MTEDEAVNAAVLTFLTGADDCNVRERLVAAIATYEAAMTVCRACCGSGRLRTHGRLVHLSDERTGSPQPRPVDDGDEITCVACGGHGVDLDQITWTCREHRFGCTADRPTHEHPGCGWTRRAQPAIGPADHS